jgi:UDP-2,3-diacylglucosamine pyrophosphatase LpxH
LVIAGDFIDFVGMSVSAAEGSLHTQPNDDERRHGLGSAVDHTIAKLERVAKQHALVFEALARFVAQGNALVIVRGNHDVDFHWPEVQSAFKDVIARYDSGAAQQVEFSDWFYYEEGVIFVEHGHQYDDFCSHEHMLHPVLPSDPRRSLRSLSDVLLRYVVRPTHGMSETGHDDASAIDYLRFAARLGFGGTLRLGTRFVRAVSVLVRMWREHMSDATQWVRAEHERKMGMLAEAKALSLINLRALANLQRPPMTRSLLRLLAGVMVDRVAISFAALGLLIWVLFARWTPTLGIVLLAVGPALVLAGVLWRRTRAAIDASQSLREHSARVARLFPAAFVVMGHTHLPELCPSDDGNCTYVNLGAWSEEDTPDGIAPALRASRTHLVVEHVDGKAVAALLSWDAEKGPQRFVSSWNA